MPKISIVIPVYNEKGNVKKLIDEISKSYDYEIIVIDDSDDETLDILKNISKKNKKVHLLHNKYRLGRGGSGKKGFEYALKIGSKYIIEMDADFSHKPNYIQNIIDKLEEGYDLVIGSRFIKGGKLKNRGFLRNSITAFAKPFVNSIIGLTLSDPTSGFRGFDASALEKIVSKLKAKDPFIVSEVLFYSQKENLKIGEIPIIFEDRHKGDSKLKIGSLIKYPFRLLKLKILN